MSLRRRVILGFIVVAAVLVGTNVALTSTFRGYLINRVDHQLVTAGGPLGARPFGNGPDGSSGASARADSEQNRAFSEYFQAIGDLDTGVLTQFGGYYDPAQRPPPELRSDQVTSHLTRPGANIKPFTTKAVTGSSEWRVIVIGGRDLDNSGTRTGTNTVSVIGLSLDGVQETLSHVQEIQIGATLAVLLALGIVSWWMIRLGVHPVAAMAETAEKISGGDLSVRVDHPNETTEVGRLGASFNRMLDRIQEAFTAREASEAKVRRFAADASHELRTPLTSIRGYAELYRAGALSNPESMADAMRRVESEAQRMGVLVEDLLALARLDQQQETERHDVDLATIATDAVADARAVEPDRTIDLSVVPAVVHADEPALRQVVANLLTNVRAHTPAGTTARVTVRVTDGAAELAVEDDGPGVTDEIAAHVFERFYRADDARTRSEGGTGLGLAIVDSIVCAHGGSVEVVSVAGRGARFVIKIPAATS